ncbi:MAG: hypothetical protein ACK5P5_06505 [Pseudobdellovibrionaceae bacterium]
MFKLILPILIFFNFSAFAQGESNLSCGQARVMDELPIGTTLDFSEASQVSNTGTLTRLKIEKGDHCTQINHTD